MRVICRLDLSRNQDENTWRLRGNHAVDRDLAVGDSQIGVRGIDRRPGGLPDDSQFHDRRVAGMGGRKHIPNYDGLIGRGRSETQACRRRIRRDVSVDCLQAAYRPMSHFDDASVEIHCGVAGFRTKQMQNLRSLRSIYHGVCEKVC